MELERIEQVGIRAAYQGGRVLTAHFGKLKEIHKKGIIDLVTAADLESEQAVLSTIRQAFPDHAILAEESGALKGASQNQWIIDPLDGTTNFAHGLGMFAVSIAFALDDEIVAGIIFNPITGELFTAVQGQGARLNNRPIQVSATTMIEDSLLVTGFPYDVHKRAEPLISRFSQCLLAAQGVRRLGSAALDLCFVACGRFDGFWEENLNPWDTAAGMLIVREAGGRVTNFNDDQFTIDQKQILATNARIHKEMTTLLFTKDST